MKSSSDLSIKFISLPNHIISAHRLFLITIDKKEAKETKNKNQLNSMFSYNAPIECPALFSWLSALFFSFASRLA